MLSSIKVAVLCITFILIALSMVTCTNKKINDSQEKNKMTTRTIEDVLKKHTKELMSIPGVVGTAQGLCNGKPCIIVLIDKKTKQLDNKIPDVLEGYKIEVEESGEIRALPENQN